MAGVTVHRVVIAGWLVAAGIVAAQGAAEAWLYSMAGGAAGAWSLSRVQWFFGE